MCYTRQVFVADFQLELNWRERVAKQNFWADVSICEFGFSLIDGAEIDRII